MTHDVRESQFMMRRDAETADFIDGACESCSVVSPGDQGNVSVLVVKQGSWGLIIDASRSRALRLLGDSL